MAAFALTWFIRELPLRDTVATASVGVAFAVPKDTDPLDNAKRVLVEAGLVEGGESGTPAAGALTEKGRQTLDTLVSCGRDRLEELSVGWQPEQHPELRELIEALLASSSIPPPLRSPRECRSEFPRGGPGPELRRAGPDARAP